MGRVDQDDKTSSRDNPNNNNNMNGNHRVPSESSKSITTLNEATELLVDIPQDDIDVRYIPRKLRTIGPILPDFRDFVDQEDPYINDCLRNYTSGWVVVVKKYENRLPNSERKRRRVILSKALPKQEFEVDAGGQDGESNDRPNSSTPTTISSSASEASSAYADAQSHNSGQGDNDADEHTPNSSFLSSMNDSIVTIKNLSLSQSPSIQSSATPAKGKPPLASDEETSEGSLTPPPSGAVKRRSDNKVSPSRTSANRLSSLSYIDSTPSHSAHPVAAHDHNRSRPTASHRLSVTSRESRSSRFFDLTNSQHDPIISNILERKVAGEESRNNSCYRHQQLLSLYMLEDDEAMIECRPPATAPKEHKGYRFMVKCTSLRLELEVEPIFLSLALYDLKEKKKVSENFYFDINSEAMKNLLSGHIPFQDMSTMCRQCILSVTYPSPDLFLVFRLEKVLQGDPTEAIDPYLTKDDRSRDKLRANVTTFCDKLGKYRQPFAWTAISLMDVLCGVSSGDRSSMGSQLGAQFGGSNDTIDSISESHDRRSIGSTGYDTMRRLGDTLSRRGSLDRTSRSERRRSLTLEEMVNALENFHPATVTMTSVFRQDYDKIKDEDLFKILSDFRSQGSSYKRLKHIKCEFKIELLPCRESPPFTLTPELAKVIPYPDERPKTRLTKELLEFPTKEVLSPWYTYRNLLYIYPKSLNFTGRPGARNITCKVQVMSGEDDYSALNSIFGKSGCPELTTEAFTQVIYHNKTPDFSDEIKARLPTKLDDQHHLLFTFYHISCQSSKKGAQDGAHAVETPVGWTWLPLYRDGRLQTGLFNLPVMMEKPPTSYSFLTPFIQIPNTKWVDNHKEVFSVQVEAVSSIHPNDPFLDAFLQLMNSIDEGCIPIRYQNNIESEFKKAILSISGAAIEPLVKFFPLVMNRLVRLLVRPPVIGGGQVLVVGQDVFESMARIVAKISKLPEPTRTNILVTFTHYQCLFPHPDVFNGHQNGLKSQPTRSNSNPNLKDLVTTINNNHQPKPSANFNRIGSVRTPSHHLRVTKKYREASSNENIYANGSFHASGSGHVPRKLFHEELLLQWVVSSGLCRELSLSNSTFFFDMIVKSASENLAVTDSFRLPRKDRFSAQFHDDLTTLLTGVVGELRLNLTRETKDMEVIQRLNCGLGFFVRDLLSLCDRNFVFSLIKLYVKTITSGHISTGHLSESVINQLFALKTDFLRIVCSHEHYFALNNPVNSPLFPSSSCSVNFGHLQATSSFFSLYDGIATFSEGHLTEDYRRQHFLSGLILSTLVHSLDMSSAIVQSKAVSLLKNVIGYHDWDPITETDPTARSKFASLYFPLVSIVMDRLGQLHDFQVPSETSSTFNKVATLKRSELKRRPVSRRNSRSSDMSDTESISSEPISTPVIFVDGGKKYPLREDTTRDLLMVFMWVIKNCPGDLLTCWFRESPTHRLTQLMDVLHICTSCFTYRGRKTVKNLGTSTLRKNSDLKLKLEDAIMGLGSARRELMLRRRDRLPTTSSASFGVGDGAATRWKKEGLSRFTNMKGKTKEEIETELIMSGHFSTEVSLVILDTIDSVVHVINETNDLSTSEDVCQKQVLLASILQVIIHQLSVNQSVMALTNIFSFQRSFLLKYPSLVFDHDLCSDLCLQLLRHCASSMSPIRSQAAASLYLLMRQNYHNSANFAKIKMQVTMSLSSLVGQSEPLSEMYLRRSLKTLLVYGVMDPSMKDTSYPDQVQELVVNLHMILSDTIRMKEYQEDPEMLMDLMYRIAKGYQNSPDLRLTWLLNMAQKHLEKGNHTEAGHCYVHCAAMVCEFLHAVDKTKNYLPSSVVSFQSISDNILEESTASIMSCEGQKEGGLCSGKAFSEAGLINLLERSAVSFTSASLYETVNEVYKLLMPIAEARRDYHKLASIHGRLQDVCMKIHLNHGRRVFETYFRVAFYGIKFGDLHGEEFVYREPHLTKLAEISHRLESFYAAHFGPEFVEVIKDSNPVDERKLDPEKVYIQITYVEPFFEDWELDRRPSLFDRNYNIRRFLFSTPFCLDGRAHGSLHEQHKRKTILTTANSFPYVKTRISVIDRTIVTLTPIEVAIDDIQKKTAELAAVTYQSNCDPKILQMLLQGCIGCTVNQGPLEVANVFLSDTSKATPERPPTVLQAKLRDAFKDFCKKCGDALRRNRTMIGPEHKEYQQEMERNYSRFTERLAPMISPSSGRSGSTLRSLRSSKTSPLI